MSETKGKSPFYPGHPIPPEYFTGRAPQIKRIRTRGVEQVAAGKSVAIFVQGEYGIGKSSVANYIRALAERESGLHGVYVTLGLATSIKEVAASILEGVARSGGHLPSRAEVVRGWFGKFFKEVQLFGVTLNLDALRREAESIATPHGLLSLLGETLRRLSGTGVRGVLLVLDEINGITANPLFAHLIKDMVEINAAAAVPVPLMLLMCGAEARRNDLIRCHPPVGRIFDVVAIDPMNEADTRVFFTRTFGLAHVTVDAEAMDNLVYYSGGLPKIMHEIGDAAYYINNDSRIDVADAMSAIEQAAVEVGRKYVEPQVVDALKSRAYHSILEKLSRLSKDEFTREELVADLNDEEARKVDNFLNRLKKLGVIRQGEVAGEYVFNVKLYQVYLTLKTYTPPARRGEPRHG